MREAINRLLVKVREPFNTPEDSAPCWRESAEICALADAERHLGHAVRAGKFWIAYDGMHINSAGNGFRIIGTFVTLAAAKQAIEDNAGISWAWAAAGTTVETESETWMKQIQARHIG